MAQASGKSAGKSFFGRFGVHIAVLMFVAIWTIPTLGILVSSLRDKDQIIASGWWSSFSSSTQTEAGRLPGPETQVEKDGRFVIEGNIFGDGPAREISAFGVRAATPTQYAAGQVADLSDGVTLQLNPDGSFVLSSPVAIEGRGQRVYFASSAPPRFTTENYETVLFSEGIGRSFINSLTVTVPATIIPIMIAAFAAYALAWMRFPGRALIIAVIIGLTASSVTGWLILDPLIAGLVALNVLYTGGSVVLGSVRALLDESLPEADLNRIRAVIQAEGGDQITLGDLRTRHAGAATFIEFHLSLPGHMTVAAAHDTTERISRALQSAVSGARVTIHIEAKATFRPPGPFAVIGGGRTGPPNHQRRTGRGTS